MKKSIVILAAACIAIEVFGYDWNAQKSSGPYIGKTQKSRLEQTKQIPQGMREIMNLTEYFRYLPHEVQRHWLPYKAASDYQVTVEFRINKDGSVSDVNITNSTNLKANTSVLNAVKNGSPYQPLPKSYKADSVKAQVVLEYRK